MPFFKVDNSLVYYAHVPKCGGTSVAYYINERFGPLAFQDNTYFRRPEHHRWTRSSAQHVDATVLEHLIPLSFFSAVFTIVRHPVDRVVSIYHFQLEVERSIPKGTGFGDWLKGLEAQYTEAPFAYDNHARPMSDIVPEGATVFHMEHGLDALVPWFDQMVGRADGPRAIIPENTRGQFVRTGRERVVPGDAELDLIASIYAEDYKRFGYRLHDKKPKTPPPAIGADFLAQRDRALAAAQQPVARLKRKLRQKLRKV